ncbi:hypothetical protein [Tenacibaculum sp. C7A-26P2]|uniref:hypothetical protein n=1 Tax=Tenacibaculum sp. C7A-26P2 TaxID=3447504 RepID=UPI003F832783
MKNTNHLSIDKSLKKHLNNYLKTFRNYRISDRATLMNKEKNKKVFLDVLFKEYDSLGEMMKSLF